MPIIDDFICAECKYEENNFDKMEGTPVCPNCHTEMIKNWSHCRTGLVNGGIPVNSRYCTDNKTLNKFSAKDDPLCQIEMGLKSDNHSGTRTFTPEQAKEFRERAAVEDSPKLRQQVLDARDRNLSERRLKKTKVAR